MRRPKELDAPKRNWMPRFIWGKGETTMKKILIIEDDSVLRDTLQKKLNIEGYEALVAQNGEIGLEKIRALKPDLVLLDIVMPKVDGMEVLVEMKNDEGLRDIPVIMISNSGQPVEIEKIMQLGAADYLIKAEFNPQEVVSKVKKSLGRKTTRGAKKILIVEDDKFLRDLIEGKLIKEGFETGVAIDGEGGLETIDKEKFDLILLDILLPGIDGFEVMRRMKKKIPVIIISNLGEKEDIKTGLDLGAVDYIIKAHFTPNEIISKVKKALK